MLQAANESYFQQQKENLTTVDPKLKLAEQRMEAMFQELVRLFYTRSDDVLFAVTVRH